MSSCGDGLLAACSLLARHWPAEGARHDAALTVGGFLARAGFEPPYIKCFIEAIAVAPPATTNGVTGSGPRKMLRSNTAKAQADARFPGFEGDLR